MLVYQRVREITPENSWISWHFRAKTWDVGEVHAHHNWSRLDCLQLHIAGIFSGLSWVCYPVIRAIELLVSQQIKCEGISQVHPIGLSEDRLPYFFRIVMIIILLPAKKTLQ